MQSLLWKCEAETEHLFRLLLLGRSVCCTRLDRDCPPIICNFHEASELKFHLGNQTTHLQKCLFFYLETGDFLHTKNTLYWANNHFQAFQILQDKGSAHPHRPHGFKDGNARPATNWLRCQGFWNRTFPLTRISRILYDSIKGMAVLRCTS